MEWRAIQIKDLILIAIAFGMLLTIASFGLYAMAIVIAAELAP